MKTYLAVYFGSLLVALALTPLVIWLARRIDAVDRPGVRTVHARPIPRIGGIAIFLSTLALVATVLFLDNAVGAAFQRIWVQVAMLLAMATLIFFLGLVDDLCGLPAKVKFLTELAAAGALCIVGVRITDISVTNTYVIPLGGWGCLLTILWIVGVTNAVNLSDGLDGLAAGISAITCGVIAVLSIQQSNVVMAVLMLALVGSLSGFLFFNFNPAKVFMGDCGSLFLGFTIAASSVMCMTKSTAIVGLALPALALGVPIFDTLFSMLRRFLERRSLFAPDRSHFHHRLIDLGLHQRHVVVAIYLATLLFAGLGLFMMASQDGRSLVVFGCVLVLIVLLFRAVGAVRLRETTTRLKEKYTFCQCARQEKRTFEHLQLKFRQAQGQDAWWCSVCEAAEQMDFAWLSLKTTYDDGRIETEIWRGPQPAANMSRIVHITIPFRSGRPDSKQEFEIAIWANGSLETAGRRATLFGRLLDEYPLILEPNRQADRPTSASTA